mmetsp:Transcript_22925/g.48751  ORF Transcript_22925/g.48751 Transcript_22925/m.48751 type:complete len:202 (-) Transcript_22925:30-635(-)
MPQQNWASWVEALPLERSWRLWMSKRAQRWVSTTFPTSTSGPSTLTYSGVLVPQLCAHLGDFRRTRSSRQLSTPTLTNTRIFCRSFLRETPSIPRAKRLCLRAVRRTCFVWGLPTMPEGPILPSPPLSTQLLDWPMARSSRSSQPPSAPQHRSTRRSARPPSKFVWPPRPHVQPVLSTLLRFPRCRRPPPNRPRPAMAAPL